VSRPRAATTVLLVATTLGPGACDTGRPAAPPASSPAGGQAEVRLTCDTGDPDAPCAFRPAEVTIRVGGTVRWIDDDASYHTVTSTDRAEVRRPNGRFNGVLDAPSASYSVTFTEPGDFPYYCQPHAEFMAGVVHVVRE